MSKNILEICLSPDLGGLELCVVDYFDYFKTRTNAYLCVAPNSRLDEKTPDANKLTLKRRKFFPFAPAFKLAKFIDENEVDCIHFHWTRDMTVTVLAKILSKKKPMLIQTRHMAITRFKDDFYHKWLYKNIDLMHAVTHQVREQLQKFVPLNVRPKIEMIYLGVKEANVDEAKIAELKKCYTITDEFVVAIIGRIEEGKGQSLLIEAIGKLKKLNIKALIVGHGMDEAYVRRLKTEAKNLSVQDRVVFTGFTKDVNEHMCLCDVTILATPKETFGLVIIESMVNKVPVIATANGGPLEIIDDEEDGLLFDSTAEDLAKKIELLCKNEQLKNKLSLNGYKKVKDKFNKETQMKKMQEIINES